MSIAVILGAGFSKCAGLPTQAEFLDLLLATELSQEPLQACITQVIGTFLGDVFGWRPGAPLPSLEDYFTCIDLSANSGHHLGVKYTPKMLRAIRRMSVHRVLQILDLRYRRSPVIDAFVASTLGQAVGFVVLNWDMVLERALQDLGRGAIDYGFPCHDRETCQKNPGGPDAAALFKVNGSSNWTYCDNCASMFYSLDRKIALHQRVGLVKADFRLFDATLRDRAFDEALGVGPEMRECPFCKNMVNTHLATFSFRKSYRTFAYPAIWHNARQLLATSSEWIFIGYSMPDADFEFKHLLKASQLALGRRKHQPPLSVRVAVKDDPAAERRYRGFFGDRVAQFCQGGLAEFVS